MSFCDEQILHVYEGTIFNKQTREDDYFDFFHDLTYHIFNGRRMILETENHYISMDSRGVSLNEKTGPVESLAFSDEFIEKYNEEWFYEPFLFIGQKLQNVKREENVYFLQFDDFEMKFIVHDDKDDQFLEDAILVGDYNRVHGYESRLKPCPLCGGQGELLLDFVDDYVVRCSNCKMSTHAIQVAKYAVKEWEQGKLECDLSEIEVV